MTDVDALVEAAKQKTQPNSGTVVTVAAAAVLDKDFGLYPASLLELVIDSDVNARFSIQGSRDGVIYKETTFRDVVAGVVFAGKLDNAFRYVRIVSDTAGDQEVILAGAR